MDVCMHVCMYVCMYVCTYVCIFAYTYIYTYKYRERVRKSESIIHKYIYTYSIHIHIYAYVHTYTYIHRYRPEKWCMRALNYACPLKTDARGLKTDGSSKRLATVGRTLHSANCFVLHEFFVLLRLRTHTRTHT
jgi:hypothetical protein